MPLEAREAACISLENYTARKIRQGEEHLAIDAMQIYRFGTENGIYLDNGKINYMLYANVAIRGAETSEIDWVDQFVENYKKCLPEELREDAYRLC